MVHRMAPDTTTMMVTELEWLGLPRELGFGRAR